MSAPHTMAEPSGPHREVRAGGSEGVPPGRQSAPPEKNRVSLYKLASVLLQYPTVALFDGLGQLAEAASAAPRASREPFGKFLEWLSRTPPDTVARHYVQTFDLRRRCALYLTYYRYGDTRKRGMAMLAYLAAYQAAGFEPTSSELPDYLPLVLDFAALHPRGEKLLRTHRADLELLLRALREAPSPYADVIAAVCAELPALRRSDHALLQRFTESGPPAEDVGLEPFAPPEFLGGFRGAVPPDKQSLGGFRGAVPPDEQSLGGFRGIVPPDEQSLEASR